MLHFTTRGYDIEVDGLSALDYHRILESLAFAFADRLALGDPHFVNMDYIIEQMVRVKNNSILAFLQNIKLSNDNAYKPQITKAHADELRGRLSDDRTFPPEFYQVWIVLDATYYLPHFNVPTLQYYQILLCAQLNSISIKDLANLTNPARDYGTSHISVVDKHRNAVALTTTVCISLLLCIH